MSYRYCPGCGNKLREEPHEGVRRYACDACEAVYYDNPKPSVACIIMDNRKVLLTKRAIEPGLGKWDLVGGFLDKGEAPETALRREVKEELGVDVSWCRFFGFYMDVYGEDGDSTLNMVYLCRLDGEPRAMTHEFQEMKWFSLSELPAEEGYAFELVGEVLTDFERHGSPMTKQDGSKKLLVVILTGPEDSERVKWGLRLALHCRSHPYGERLLDDVKVLLFGDGVSIVDPKNPCYAEIKERIEALKDAGVEVAVCVSIASALGLEKHVEDLGLELAHASIYTAKQVSRGYTIFSF